MCTKRVVVGCAAPPFYPIMTALASAPPLIVTTFWLMSVGIMYPTMGIQDGTGAEFKHTNAQIAVFVDLNEWLTEWFINPLTSRCPIFTYCYEDLVHNNNDSDKNDTVVRLEESLQIWCNSREAVLLELRLCDFVKAYKLFAHPVPPNTTQYQFIMTKYQPVSSYTDPEPRSSCCCC